MRLPARGASTLQHVIDFRSVSLLKREGRMDSVPRLFGEVALEKSYVTVAQLYEALTIQARAEARNEPYQFLGQILTELDYMTDRQVLEVLSEIHATEEVF